MLFAEINHLPPFIPGSPLWDSLEPVFSDPASFPPSLLSVMSSPDEPDLKPRKTLASRPRLPVDERKRRRMISNRDSARRSRVRKQKHFVDLGNQLDRLGMEKRELMNRLRLAVYRNELIRRENGQLQSEAILLRRRLWDMRQVLLVRQLEQHLNPLSAWPCNNNITYINEDQLTLNALIA